MLRTLFLILLGASVISGAVFAYAFRGANIDDYEDLVEPQILNMFDERMVVIEAQGNPNQVSRDIFAIFADYHIEDRMPLNFTMPPMRVRWDSPYDTPASGWVGLYAIPATANVDELPSGEGAHRYNVRFEDWEYGEVAQILHVGPYEQEAETIATLQQFIVDQGYETIGEREEVYLRGPSVWPPSRNKYTIIRYRVQPVGSVF